MLRGATFQARRRLLVLWVCVLSLFMACVDVVVEVV